MKKLLLIGLLASLIGCITVIKGHGADDGFVWVSTSDFGGGEIVFHQPREKPKFKDMEIQC